MEDIDITKYKNGINEALWIIEHMKEEDRIKIPDIIIKNMKNLIKDEEKVELDYQKNIEDMDLKIETRKILWIIYMFWLKN